MKELIVCARDRLYDHMLVTDTKYVLSIVDPGWDTIDIEKAVSFPDVNWKLVRFEDSEVIGRGPTLEHAREILEWAKIIPVDAEVIVHCHQGISRSTATALAMLVQFHGVDRLEECGERLLKARSYASPNLMLAGLFDQLLGCDGEFLALAAKIRKITDEKYLFRAKLAP